MCRKMFLALVVGVLALFSAGAEELLDASAVFAKNSYRNYAEVVQLSEAGKLKTGSLLLDWPVLVSKFMVGKITAREAWDSCCALADNSTDQDLWPLWFSVAPNIVRSGKDAALNQEIMTQLKAAADGSDLGKRAPAIRGLGVIYAQQGKFVEAWPYLCMPEGDFWHFKFVANKLLGSNLMSPATVYAGLRSRLLVRGDAGPQDLLELTRLMLDASTAAAIPKSEVKATLQEIDLLYVSYSVGESETAKAWGEFVGAVEEIMKRCQ